MGEQQEQRAATPTLAEYRASTDRNAFWRLGCGDHQNLLDEAIDALDEAREWNVRLHTALAAEPMSCTNRWLRGGRRVERCGNCPGCARRALVAETSP